MTDDLKEKAVPEGMVPYGPDHPEYPNVPRDAGETVDFMTRGGSRSTMKSSAVHWRYGTFISEIYGPMPAQSEVIAYTPAAIPEGMGEGVIQADRDAAAEAAGALEIDWAAGDGYFAQLLVQAFRDHRLAFASPTPEPDFAAWLKTYVGEQDATTMRFTVTELEIAFNASRVTALASLDAGSASS